MAESKAETPKDAVAAQAEALPIPTQIAITDLKQLKFSTEVNDKISTEFKLGEFESKPYAGTKVHAIEGSVDATEFDARVRPPEFYKEKVLAAKALLAAYGHSRASFESNTQKLIASNQAILKDLSGYNEVDASGKPDFSHATFENSFIKNHDVEAVRGPNGIFNLVLAFQRLLRSRVAVTEDLLKIDDKTALEALTKKTSLTLTIGKTKNNQAERFVRLRVDKISKDKPDAPAPKGPGSGEAPLPKSGEGSAPLPKPGEGSAPLPKFGEGSAPLPPLH